MRKSANSSSGFVLLEVLVSAMILSVGCLLLVETLQGSLRATRRVQDAYEAGLNAANLLWMLDRSRDASDLSSLLNPGHLSNLRLTIDSPSLDNPGLSDQLEVRRVLLQWQPGTWGQDSFSLSGYYPHDNK